ncbi:hypothetical protein D3C71_1618710 [compost metagenome]
MSPATFGCGQSVPHKVRSGKASASARTNGMPSANGRRPAAMRSMPDTFTQACGTSARLNKARIAGDSSPSAAFSRPMWSTTNGTGSARRRGNRLGSIAPSRCRHRCQPSGAIKATTRSNTAGSGAPPRWGTKLKRAARTPPSCNDFTLAAVASAPSNATPR